MYFRARREKTTDKQECTLHFSGFKKKICPRPVTGLFKESFFLLAVLQMKTHVHVPVKA